MQPDLTDIVLLLDRSGSMQAIRDDMIGGINSFIDAQKAAPGRATFSLYLFDHLYEPKVVAADLATIAPFAAADLVPRGSTSLLDAMGRCINETGERLNSIPEADRPARVVFVVVTDGYENTSREFGREKVAGMVKHQSDAYSWEFVYLGADQDAIAVAAGMGISASNAMSFAGTGESTRLSAANLASAVSRYRGGGTARGQMFTPEEQDATARS